MDWIRAHLAVLDWIVSHIGLPLFAVLGGFFAARWTDRLKRKTDEQRATVQAAMHLAGFVRRWRNEFYKVEAGTLHTTRRPEWSTAAIVSPLKDPRMAELVPSLRPPARNALLELDERTPSYAGEIERLLRWQSDDVDTDAPAVLAEFVLAVDAVLQTVRQAADLPSLPEEETGISYERRWLRTRKEWIRRRDAERLVDQVETSQINARRLPSAQVAGALPRTMAGYDRCARCNSPRPIAVTSEPREVTWQSGKNGEEENSHEETRGSEARTRRAAGRQAIPAPRSARPHQEKR